MERETERERERERETAGRPMLWMDEAAEGRNYFPFLIFCLSLSLSLPLSMSLSLSLSLSLCLSLSLVGTHLAQSESVAKNVGAEIDSGQ